MKLRIKTDAPEEGDFLAVLADSTTSTNPFSPAAIGKLESVFEKELPLLRQGLENYAEIEVSVSFLDPIEMKDVNKQHRGLDEPTDVLTFPLWAEEERLALPVPLLPLGDIVICPQEAEREHAPMTCVEALCLVLAHGFLHLLGWDHDTPEKEQAMWDRQELLKAKLLGAVEEVS